MLTSGIAISDRGLRVRRKVFGVVARDDGQAQVVWNDLERLREFRFFSQAAAGGLVNRFLERLAPFAAALAKPGVYVFIQGHGGSDAQLPSRYHRMWLA
jgi:hypothetical protein